jgi:hypothetical protein
LIATKIDCRKFEDVSFTPSMPDEFYTTVCSP